MYSLYFIDRYCSVHSVLLQVSCLCGQLAGTIPGQEESSTGQVCELTHSTLKHRGQAFKSSRYCIHKEMPDMCKYGGGGVLYMSTIITFPAKNWYREIVTLK
jgi:hypothetical protein